jgi:hypothetical protein
VPVLDVGLEDVRHLTGRRLALAHALLEQLEPLLAALPPALQPVLDDVAAELGVTEDRSCREQRGGGVEVVLGEVDLLVDAAHGVPEFEPGVPHRVPDRRRHLLETGRLAVVHQQQVEVALR